MLKREGSSPSPETIRKLKQECIITERMVLLHW